MTAPAPMSVTLASTESPVLSDVLVATLSDGRLGFVCADLWWFTSDASLVLTDGARRHAGPAQVVRSGTAYEETRGRLRAHAGRLERWRLRRDRPVVLVETRRD